MVWSKPFGAHRGDIAEAALHLISDRQRGEKIGAGAAGIFARREHRAQIVAGMAGLLRSKIAVVEIQVADQSGIVEGRPIGRGLAGADQRT